MDHHNVILTLKCLEKPMQWSTFLIKSSPHTIHPSCSLSMPILTFATPSTYASCLTDWLAGWLAGFFTLFGTTHLVPCSLHAFSACTALARGSITFKSYGTLLTIIKRKTWLAFLSKASWMLNFLSAPYYRLFQHLTPILSSPSIPPHSSSPATS